MKKLVKMKRFAFALLILSQLAHAGSFSAPTVEHHPWYAGLFAGVGFLNNNMTQPVTVSLESTSYSPNILINHKQGYQMGAMLGYRYRRFRFEGQFNYQQSNTNRAISPFLTLPAVDQEPSQIAQFVGHASLRTYLLALNVYMDFPDLSEHFVPFIGLGAGAAHTRSFVDGPFAILDDGDFIFPESFPLVTLKERKTVVVSQGIIGFRYNVDDKRFVHFTARYMASTKPKFYTNRLRNYLFDLGYSIILDMF